MTRAVLEGIRVLDFGRYIAGPFCAALLADLGADVIRVERVGGGEDRYVYPVTADGDGALYLQMNRNKRGITLDVKKSGADEVLRRLVRSADVVIANLPEDSLRDMGLDYESLKAMRSDVILTSISAFGREGPYEGRVGFDGVGQAMSGAVWLTGRPGEPTKSFASWVDFTSAMLASNSTMAALFERGRSGEGQEVRGSLFGGALTVMNFPLIEQALTGADREATGNRAQSGGPADAFRTRDGWIMIQVIGAPLFKRWARLMGETHWLEDPRFASDSLRAENGAVLSVRTAAWAAELTTADALAMLAASRIPAGPILSPQQVLDDPHVQGARMLTTINYPGAPKPVPFAMAGARLAGTPQALSRRPPLVGEHTSEVLQELGFTPVEVETLRENAVI